MSCNLNTILSDYNVNKKYRRICYEYRMITFSFVQKQERQGLYFYNGYIFLPFHLWLLYVNWQRYVYSGSFPTHHDLSLSRLVIVTTCQCHELSPSRLITVTTYHRHDLSPSRIVTVTICHRHNLSSLRLFTATTCHRHNLSLSQPATVTVITVTTCHRHYLSSDQRNVQGLLTPGRLLQSQNTIECFWQENDFCWINFFVRK